MNSLPSFLHILLLGSIAGFTIYLGLPFALVRSKSLRTFANALSVGVLIFILIEILEKSFETVNAKVMDALTHRGDWGTALIYVVLLIFGVSGAYLGLVEFEKSYLGGDEKNKRKPATIALIIAIGIGLHNFSEGLAIGQELASGALALGLILVIGFALHNTTEGFGIAAPLTGEKPKLSFLFLLGLIGGGPTLIGTLVGESLTLPVLEIFFLALASGAILYIIAELTHIGRMKGEHTTLAAGILTGLFLAFASEVFISGAQTMAFTSPTSTSQQTTLVVTDNSLSPATLVLKANQPNRLIIQNDGTQDHYIAIQDMGIQREVEVGQSKALLLFPTHTGDDYLVLDPDRSGTKIQTRLVISQ
jgi:ZIP family zinc transporter